MNFPIRCHGCGNSFDTMKVTASLKCARCGSDDLDLDDRTANLTSMAEVRVIPSSNSGGGCTVCGNTATHRAQSVSEHGVRDLGEVCDKHAQQANSTGRIASGGTGWGQPRPNPLEGWAVQAPGNYPGPNPQAHTQNVGGDTSTCQACGGSGVDSRASGGGYDEIPCRNCHGSGVQSTHAQSPGSVNDASNPAGPPIGGARYASVAGPFPWNIGSAVTYTVTYKEGGRRSSDPMGSPESYLRDDPDYDNRSGKPRKADTRSPDVKYRSTSEPFNKPHVNAPLPLTGASCPSCGAASTSLVRDHKDQAWWQCANCGSLANVDRNPQINPFSPPDGFQPDRSFGEKKRVARFRRSKPEPTGKALRMVRATLQTNPGLTVGQALTLVRNALAKYPE